jgi:hypothetical protein
MVVEDSEKLHVPVEELPHFTCFLDHGYIHGEAYALAMNAWILDYISGRVKNPPYKIYPVSDQLSYDTWFRELFAFLDAHFDDKKITVAGKNVAGFDIPFLPALLQKRFRHKVLDPGTLYVNWNDDDQVPNFELCKRRADLDPVVRHDAREDAIDVIRLLRKSYIKS